MALIEIKVPDIGDFKDVEIIEVLVQPGDAVEQEASLVTLESDKASMEVVFKLQEPSLTVLTAIFNEFTGFIYPPRSDQETRGHAGLEELGRYRTLHADSPGRGQLYHLDQES